MKTFRQLPRVTLLSLIFAFSTPALSDQVIHDDLIVTGNTCVGAACVDGEEFTFLGIKIKSDEPRILFDDTSSSAGTFPANNWMIGITDNGTSGTANFFINDADTDSNVLVLQPGISGGVALGSGSDMESNAISIGALGMERRIVHVAHGENGTDAVNKAQLDSQLSTLSSSVDERIDKINARIDDLLKRIKKL